MMNSNLNLSALPECKFAYQMVNSACAELYGGRVRLREDGQRKAEPQNF